MAKDIKQAPIIELPVTEDVSESSLELPSVALGRIVALTPQKGPMVQYEHSPGNVARLALQTFEIKAEHIGRQVTLQFVDGDVLQPVVAGIVWDGQAKTSSTVDLSVDSDKLTLSAKREVVLKCGKASITLKKNGTIVLRGTNLESRASGVNKLRGRAIQLN